MIATLEEHLAVDLSRTYAALYQASWAPSGFGRCLVAVSSMPDWQDYVSDFFRCGRALVIRLHRHPRAAADGSLGGSITASMA
ncbi:hypothetical protein BCEP4_730018 [Burkholderia cepacia]|nr:hypothetical protein BCEP4_730018 [Burkholderia cepacia]